MARRGEARGGVASALFINSSEGGELRGLPCVCGWG